MEICAEVGSGLGPDYMYADTGWVIRGWMEFTANAHWRCGESGRSTEKIRDPDGIESQNALTSMPLGPWAEEWKTTDVTVLARGLS